MTFPNISTRDRRLKALLADFGYRFEGQSLISVGIKGFTSDRIVGRYRDLFDAAESLVPIIHDETYTKRFADITSIWAAA